MQEPNINSQAFLYRSYHGYYFVRYPDGEISGLMYKAMAESYARIFGGTVHRHSQAPKERGPFFFAIFLLVICLAFLGYCAKAYGTEFKPLTRDEPIVRMVLQEAASEPLAGQVAVAGTVLDRMADPRWPSTSKDVVYQPWQYTGMRAKLREYTRGEIEIARLAVELARSGTRPCGTVLWYHTTEVNPKWAADLQVSCQIGEHIFYGDRDDQT